MCEHLSLFGAFFHRSSPFAGKAEINPVLCKGDGLCSAKCPTSAVALKHFTDEALLSQIDAAGVWEETPEELEAAVGVT